MLNQYKPDWAKFICFWTALLRTELVDKEDCVYIMQYIPSLAAKAWLKFCEFVPTKDEFLYIIEKSNDTEVCARALDKFCEFTPTKDEFCYIMEWSKNTEVRLRAWDKFAELAPSEEDFRYLIKWVPEMRILPGFTWLNTGITPDDLVYVFEAVPEIRSRLSAKLLKTIIQTSNSVHTKISAGVLLLKQSQSMDTLVFLSEQVPELKPMLQPFADHILNSRPKKTVGFQIPDPPKPDKPVKK